MAERDCFRTMERLQLSELGRHTKLRVFGVSLIGFISLALVQRVLERLDWMSLVLSGPLRHHSNQEIIDWCKAEYFVFYYGAQLYLSLWHGLRASSVMEARSVRIDVADLSTFYAQINLNPTLSFIFDSPYGGG
jgi:hypothetical protein